MDLDLFALRAFVAVAGHLNFAAAAQSLHVSASRLTRTIQALETRLGVRLLARSTHGSALTAEGAEFLASARRILAEADWATRRLATPRAGGPATFVVGCMAGALYDALPDRIRAARGAHPHLRFRLVECDERLLTGQVLDGSLDMAFLYFPQPDESLASRVVSRRTQWVAMAPDHPLARRRALRIADLAGHVTILPDETLAPRLHRWYRDMLADAGPLRSVAAHQIHVALGLCAAGEGLCIVAEHLRRVRSDDLRYVPLRDAPMTELAAIWRSDAPARQVAQFLARW